MADDNPAAAKPARTPRHQEIEALWEAHLAAEFETQSSDAALQTMTADAYVNHIPTMTGGVGHEALADFYSKQFIPQMPPDVEMTPISRTIGETQLVDEMVVSFTHTVSMAWMLPGIRPTGKRVEVALVVLVGFSGDKIAHEHIYWDQATVLAQLDLIDPDSLPVTGAEAAHKALDSSLPSNQLIERSKSAS